VRLFGSRCTRRDARPTSRNESPVLRPHRPGRGTPHSLVRGAGKPARFFPVQAPRLRAGGIVSKGLNEKPTNSVEATMSLFFRQLVRRLRRALGKGSEARRPVRRRSRLGVELLEGRVVPATAAVDAAGVLSFTAGAGIANNLTVSVGNGNYTLN